MTERTGASAVLRKKLGGVQARGYHYPIQREPVTALEFAAAKGASAALRTGADAIAAQPARSGGGADGIIALTGTDCQPRLRILRCALRVRLQAHGQRGRHSYWR